MANKLTIVILLTSSLIIIVRGLNSEDGCIGLDDRDIPYDELSLSGIGGKVEMGFTIKNNILQGAKVKLNPYSHQLGKMFLNKLNKNPNHIWQINAHTEEMTTFAEIKDNTIRAALWLQKTRIGKNDVVCICSPDRMDTYIPLLAIFYVGAVYNPWAPNISLERARHYMKLIRPKIIFTTANDVKVIQNASILENIKVKLITFDKHPEFESLEDAMRLQKSKQVRNFQVSSIDNPKNLAILMFSSGTSGFFKAVSYTYETAGRMLANDKLLNGGQGSVELWYASLGWATGTLCMFGSILSGAKRIYHSTFEPEETCKVIEKFQVNWTFLAPTMIAHLVRSNVFNKYELKSLKKILSAGGRIDRLNICYMKNNLRYTRLIKAYGMTELGAGIARQNEYCQNIESVGFIMPYVQLKVVDINNGTVLGPNNPGEIHINTSTLMLGYYNNPTATKEAFDKQGWFRTGDLGYYDENGEIFVIDRLKELIKNRGYHVMPSEIEELLMRHPDVILATVVGKPHELYIEEAIAFVKKSPNSMVSERDLVNLTFQYGNERKLWGGVRFLEELPLLGTGKIDRFYLKQMAKAFT